MVPEAGDISAAFLPGLEEMTRHQGGTLVVPVAQDSKYPRTGAFTIAGTANSYIDARLGYRLRGSAIFSRLFNTEEL